MKPVPAPHPPALRACRLAALLGLLAATVPTRASAETYMWLSTANGSMNSTGNWPGGDGKQDPINPPKNIPPSSAETTLVFGGSAGPYVYQDIANSFLLNALIFTSAAGEYQFSGNQFNFVNNGSVAPVLRQNSAQAITVDNNLLIGSGNGPTVLTVGGTGTGTLALSGNITEASDFLGRPVAGGLTVAGSSLVILRGNNTYTGTTNLQSGTLRAATAKALGSGGTINFGGGTLQYGGTHQTDYSGRFSTADSQLYRIDTNGQTITFDTGLTSSGGSLTKLGANALILTAASTYTGTTNVTAGGLILFNGGSLGATTINVGAGASFLVNGTGSLPATNAGGLASSSNLVLNGTSDNPAEADLLGSGALYRGTVIVGDTGAGTLAQTSGSLNINPAGSVVVARQTGSSGTYSLNGGTLTTTQVTGGNGTSTFHFGGGTLRANDNSVHFLERLTTADVGAEGARINTAGYNATASQALSHDTTLGSTADGGLTKVGAGTLTLSGISSYTGPTNVNAGTLAVAGALNGTGAITVADGATLTGTGSVSGAVSVQSGGTLAADINAGGTLTLRNSLILNSGSLAAFTLAASGNSAPLSVDGQLAVDGSTLRLEERAGFSLAVGQTFFLIVNQSYGVVQGTFANAPNGIYTDAAGNTFQVNYYDNSGGIIPNDISVRVLSVVPEPSTWALFLGGAGLLVLTLRHRRRPCLD